MKSCVTALALLFLSHFASLNGQESAEPEAPRAIIKQKPKAQVISFFAALNENNAVDGMVEMLLANPTTQRTDAQAVANTFVSRMAQMGQFIDFEILAEKSISDRVRVVKTVANFENQPFVIEFTFYDPASGHWRLAHLRYDWNFATMFLEPIE